MYRIFLEPYCLSINHKDDKLHGQRYININSSDLPFSQIFSEWVEDPNIGDLALVAADPKAYYQELCSLFTQIKAAGGLVENPRREILMIYRLGKWDLPKGKVDDGETIRMAATREVEEECGVSGLSITVSLPETMHVYPGNNGRWILKTTYWFRMNALNWEHLVPQEKENIEAAKWVKKEDLSVLLDHSYRSIRFLLSNFLAD